MFDPAKEVQIAAKNALNVSTTCFPCNSHLYPHFVFKIIKNAIATSKHSEALSFCKIEILDSLADNFQQTPQTLSKFIEINWNYSKQETETVAFRR